MTYNSCNKQRLKKILAAIVDRMNEGYEKCGDSKTMLDDDDAMINLLTLRK